MQVLGLVFAGSATAERTEMARFVADMFELPDGSRFAVTDERAPGDGSRTIGFLVQERVASRG